jgi:hypothetical protein
MREQFNCRIHPATKAQIEAIASDYGMSQSEVIALAVERLARSLESDPAYRRIAETIKKKHSCSP